MNEREIFAMAMQKPTAAERSAYLDGACGQDADLRRRIEGLLQEQEHMGSYLENPPAGLGATLNQQAAEHPGAVIGPYKLLQQVGEGGMGTVYMAEQSHPVQRKVALKVIKAGMDSGQVIARFEAERQALAMMDHVNIARVFDGGTTEAGRPYFVMELVHGVPITKYCDDNHLTPRERLELFVPVCQAIQHAHQKGIIHRDIKPSNVMVTLYDGKPVPKVIDFGVAKATEQKLTERTLFTQYGTMVGTLEYMSPEQAEMSALGVDTRSDIFSLGVLLYELLTGSTPLSPKRMKEAAYAEIIRMIKEEEPPKPSTRLSDSGEALASISANRHTEPAKLTKLVKGELDWIVMKTLEKDRNRRYETASGFAADVQRYLADEPVQACPPTAMYRFRKFARRNKRVLATAAVVAAAVLVVAGTLGWAIRDREANAQQVARERAARQAAVEQEASLALKEAEQWQEQGKWPEALSAVKRAQGLLAGGGSDELRERVHQLRKDLEMVTRLDDIRIRMSEVQTERVFSFNEGVFSFEVADREYGKAFADHGIEIDSFTISEAAERIRKGSIAVQMAAALNDWAMARRSSPNDETRWKHLLAVARAADPDEWRNQFRDAWERRDTAALSTLAASDKIPTLSAATLYLLGSTLQEIGAAQEAFAVLRQGHDRHPDDFWINLALANCCMYSLSPPRMDDAIRFLTAAKAIRKDNPAPDRYLGRALLDKGAFDESIAASRQAILLNPNWYPPYVNLGAALLGKGQLDDSIAASRQAIQFTPNYAVPHINLASALRRQGKVDEAIACYRKVIELDPNNANAHNSLAWLLATCADAKLRDPAQAVALAKNAVQLDPTNGFYWQTLGYAEYRSGNWKAAIAALEKVKELGSPGDSLEWFPLAIAHFQLGEKEQAGQWYDLAIEWMDKNQPQNEELRRFRAEASELLGVKEKEM